MKKGVQEMFDHMSQNIYLIHFLYVNNYRSVVTETNGTVTWKSYEQKTVDVTETILEGMNIAMERINGQNIHGRVCENPM